MATLSDLLHELRQLGVGPGEIDIPFRWYRQLMDHAQELADGDEADDDADFD